MVHSSSLAYRLSARLPADLWRDVRRAGGPEVVRQPPRPGAGRPASAWPGASSCLAAIALVMAAGMAIWADYGLWPLALPLALALVGVSAWRSTAPCPGARLPGPPRRRMARLWPLPDEHRAVYRRRRSGQAARPVPALCRRAGGRRSPGPPVPGAGSRRRQSGLVYPLADGGRLDRRAERGR